MKNTKIAILVIILLMFVVGAGSFFAGVQYQKSKRPSIGEQFRSGERPQGFGGRLQGQSRPISGEIIDSDEKGITVKLPDGSSRIIFVGESVQINKSAPGTKEDLIKGVQVFVVGSENSDGSITAQNIQLNPILR